MSATNLRELSVEKVLYTSIFFLALSLRLLNLGEGALSEYEASFALQAYQLAHSQAANQVPLPGNQPVYVIVTGIIFALFKDSNAFARLLPALAGSSLVLAPLLFRQWSGFNPWIRRASLLLAVCLAFDPALVALSRQAGSPIITLALLILTAGCLLQGQAGWAGLAAGLALLSGPSFFYGLPVIGLTIIGFMYLRRISNAAESTAEKLPKAFTQAGFWRTWFIALAGTVLLGGMLWLRAPQGLALLAESLPAYLKGWIQSSGMPPLRLPAAILLYQPIAVVFGLLATIRAWRNPQPIFLLLRFLSLWAAAALVLGMLYPSRQVSDGLWVILPLWALAAMELSRFAAAPIEAPLRLPTLGLGGVSALFMILIWYNLLRLGNLQAQPVLYLTIIGGLGLMTVIVISLVGLGWSWRTASIGFSLGFCLVAGGYMLAAMWSMSQVRPNHPAELWSMPPGSGQTRELVSTLEEIAQWNSGLRNELDIQVTFPSTSLQWALRNFSQVETVTALAANQQPAIIISLSSQENPSLESRYRGQELIFSRSTSWEGALPPNLLRWLTFREFATTSQKMILWTRADLFPGRESDPGTQGLVPVP